MGILKKVTEIKYLTLFESMDTLKNIKSYGAEAKILLTQ